LNVIGGSDSTVSGGMPVSTKAATIRKSITELVILTVIFLSLLPDYAIADDIYNAVANGDLLRVKFFVEKDPSSVNSKDPSKWTPLHFASVHSKDDIAEYLISMGADVNIMTFSGWTPLNIAVDWGIPRSFILDADIPKRKRIIALLVANGAKVNEITEAIALDSVEKVDAFIRSNPRLVNRIYEYETAFHCAAFWGSNRVAAFLINTYAPFDDCSDMGTPLVVASMMGNKEIVKMLISKNAYINSYDNFKCTSLYKAVMCGYGNVFLSYYDPREGKLQSMLMKVSLEKPEDYVEIVKMLIAAGADVNKQPDFTSWNSKYPKGLYPLQIAAIKGWTEMAELLLSAGARSVINEKDDIWHYTPLHHAAEQGNIALVKVLLDNGADKEIKDDQGRTPLKIAEEKGHKEIADLLQGRGAKK